MCDAVLTKAAFVRYRRLAVVHTVGCWLVVVGHMLLLVVPQFLQLQSWDLTFTPLYVHISARTPYVRLFEAFVLLMYCYSYGAWIFPQSVNYISKVLQCTNRQKTTR